MRVPLVKVGDLSDQIRGVSYEKEDASSSPQPGYIPILRANNITADGLVFNDLVFVPAERVSEKQRIRQHDVVVAASSGSLEVVGKAAPALADFKGGFGAFCKVLRPNSKVHPGYFAHFFKTRHYRQRVSAVAAGANINNLRNEHLDEFEIPLPQLEEQRRIATILDAAEALREKRRQSLAKLDTLTQSIFLDLFGDPIENPRRFKVKPLIEIVDPARPISYGILMPGPDQKVGVAYVRVVDMKEGGIDLASVRKTTPEISNEFRRSLLKPGDILLSIRGHVGRLAIVPTELDGANITQDTARLAIKDAEAVFVRECLRAPGFQRWMTRHTKGAAVRGINLGDVKLIPIIIPPLPLQREFAAQVSAVERLKTAQRTSLKKLDALFASLQHRAFRGEL